MVAELRRDDMAEEAGTIRDSVAFRLVERVLQSVRMEPFLIAPYDLEQYRMMVGTLDTSRTKNRDDEALYVTYLKALSEAVSKIDITYHHSLLNNIFAVRIWYLQRDTMVALLDLITRLAAVADQYLRECLQMLVNNFTPPIVERNEVPTWAVSRKKDIFSHLCGSLKTISDTVPLAPRMLRDIIDRSMPKLFDNKAKMISFVECMLGLDTDRMGDLIGAILLAKVVDLLTELDVNITWEDILQEEHDKGIFEMELEDLDADDDGDGFGQAGTKVCLGGNACAEKLDGLMVVVCEHLKSLDRQRLYKEFVILKTIFRASLLRVHRSKFAQFIMFYTCSLDPKTLGEGFAVFLTDIVTEKKEDPISRLVDWCVDYCDHQSKREATPIPNHQLFYATCQAVMYVLCFRLRSIMDYPNLKSDLFHMPFGFLFRHRLEPLKVCLPSIVNEFLRQAKDAGLVAAFVDPAAEDAIESDLSRTFGGINRLDMFFPFDPYLLKESDRYIRPNFEFWSMVKTTYSDDTDDDDDELEDLDAPEMNVGSLDDHVEIDINSDDDDLEYSMNKMSITPHHSFLHQMAMDSDGGLSMPARIRPSTSPPSRWAMSGESP
uniref:RNA polymerase I-specific transcription initiation factor RRN3 n=1 Tax=Triticum aestivum TaxID=4565 RepID=A0A3B6TJT1_WHEAT